MLIIKPTHILNPKKKPFNYSGKKTFTIFVDRIFSPLHLQHVIYIYLSISIILVNILYQQFLKSFLETFIVKAPRFREKLFMTKRSKYELTAPTPTCIIIRDSCSPLVNISILLLLFVYF